MGCKKNTAESAQTGKIKGYYEYFRGPFIVLLLFHLKAILPLLYRAASTRSFMAEIKLRSLHLTCDAWLFKTEILQEAKQLAWWDCWKIWHHWTTLQHIIARSKQIENGVLFFLLKSVYCLAWEAHRVWSSPMIQQVRQFSFFVSLSFVFHGMFL